MMMKVSEVTIQNLLGGIRRQGSVATAWRPAARPTAEQSHKKRKLSG